MSVQIKVLHEQDAEGKEYGDRAFTDGRVVAQFEGVIGYVLAAVVKDFESGEIALKREIAVYADNAEDNQLSEETVKKIEAKLNEAFPDPNKPEPSKLWVPS